MLPFDKKYKLSNSTANEFSLCQRKSYFRKMCGDPGREGDMTALQLGSAFHRFLELTLHQWPQNGEAILISVMEETKLNPDLKCLITSMIIKYCNYQKQIDRKFLAFELYAENKMFQATVDALYIEGSGWGILDLKTSGGFTETKKATLERDSQINLYSQMAPEIAKAYNKKYPKAQKLDGKDYKGFRYLVVSKPRLTFDSTANFVNEVKRFMDKVQITDLFLPVINLKPEEARFRMLAIRKQFLEVWKGKRAPVPNYNSCDSYNRLCSYYDRCYRDKTI